uniref:Uncharacterized protein MANES_02G143700 n=1 Tax=Rhizophora mucronata TaxID=61149 RepID=A0A2P2KPN0_RHIMU
MKAVEAAEATIKQQVEENTRLRNELQKRIQELETYKLGEMTGQRSHSVDAWNQQVHYGAQSVPSLENQEYMVKNIDNTSSADSSSTLVLRQDMRTSSEHHNAQNHVESHSNTTQINGTLKVLPGGQSHGDNAGLSQLSSPSPSRYQMGGEYDTQYSLSGHGQMQMSEVNNSSYLWKQDFALKIREHEEEISQLRKHLADYSIKEAQIHSEKYVLEKRIAYMRLAFDQQQQDLVDAASKAISYRQDIIEENIRLTYALQAAHQERTTFVSSLLPLLAEYSLRPPVLDAQSIVSNVKVLFRHLQEKLILTESKLKESQYQLAPLPLDVNLSNFGPQSLSPSVGATPANLDKKGLQLAPQSTYSHGKISTADAQTGTDWDIWSRHQGGLGGATAKRGGQDDVVGYSPPASRNFAFHEVSAITRGDANMDYYGEGPANKQVMFREPVSNNEMDEPDAEGLHNERGPPANWGSGASPYPATLDDPSSSYSPYLPPVLEEPSSSFSEAADEDPLPAIDGLQISGEAFPGRELQACGYSINGTTSCNFEWVRHLEDGSVNYIDGAKKPNYLVTADDVDAYLAIEVQPLDDRKRKGELVKVFANEHRKIPCDPEMQSHVGQTLQNGHASYKVSLPSGYIDMWEPATLAIKREGYSIKCTGSHGVVAEKFLPTTTVTIPYGHPDEFIIIQSSGTEHHLRADNGSTDISCSRDTIVLTLRFFIRRVGIS